MVADAPDPIDVHVGMRLKERRRMIGMSQTQLGHALGISFQQVQKYERGTNRIGSGRLFRISVTLNVSLTYFFEGVEVKMPDCRGPKEKEQVVSDDIFRNDGIYDLLDAYYRIGDDRIRKKVTEIARLLST